jgi:hypothetical protein
LKYGSGEVNIPRLDKTCKKQRKEKKIPFNTYNLDFAGGCLTPSDL